MVAISFQKNITSLVGSYHEFEVLILLGSFETRIISPRFIKLSVSSSHLISLLAEIWKANFKETAAICSNTHSCRRARFAYVNHNYHKLSLMDAAVHCYVPVGKFGGNL